MNRGSYVNRNLADPRLIRFNEAPIHESGKLQRGATVKPCSFASMRPRFMNRGSKALYPYRIADCLASMRPRFMNRGSHRLHVVGTQVVRRLQ